MIAGGLMEFGATDLIVVGDLSPLDILRHVIRARDYNHMTVIT